MTPVDRFLPQPPQITIQGSLGGFRVGNGQNQYQSFTNTYSWADNVSWIHGRHMVRTGVFVMLQTAQTFPAGAARGQISFNNFTDFLLGMSAAQNGSPSGLSNIQSITASEGVGPSGEVISLQRTRTGHGAAFL